MFRSLLSRSIRSNESLCCFRIEPDAAMVMNLAHFIFSRSLFSVFSWFHGGMMCLDKSSDFVLSARHTRRNALAYNLVQSADRPVLIVTGTSGHGECRISVVIIRRRFGSGSLIESVGEDVESVTFKTILFMSGTSSSSSGPSFPISFG